MLVRNGSFIVAVDGSRMSIFRNIGEAFKPSLELVEEHQNPRFKSSELGDDKAGRNAQSSSPRKGAYEQTDLHQQEEDRFSREAAERMELLMKDSTNGLILVAAPRALGMIRQYIGPATSKQLSAEIAKDFGPHDAEPLTKMLEKYEA